MCQVSSSDTTPMYRPDVSMIRRVHDTGSVNILLGVRVSLIDWGLGWKYYFSVGTVVHLLVIVQETSKFVNVIHYKQKGYNLLDGKTIHWIEKVYNGW